MDSPSQGRFITMCTGRSLQQRDVDPEPTPTDHGDGDDDDHGDDHGDGDNDDSDDDDDGDDGDDGDDDDSDGDDEAAPPPSSNSPSIERRVNADKPANATNLPSQKFTGGLNDLSCACNCTYISALCCNTADGIVFEPPHKKLGVVDLMEPDTCCDVTTGDVVAMAPGANRNPNTTFCPSRA
jgi:hypothetical protein